MKWLIFFLRLFSREPIIYPPNHQMLNSWVQEVMLPSVVRFYPLHRSHRHNDSNLRIHLWVPTTHSSRSSRWSKFPQCADQFFMRNTLMKYFSIFFSGSFNGATTQHSPQPQGARLSPSGGIPSFQPQLSPRISQVSMAIWLASCFKLAYRTFSSWTVCCLFPFEWL